MSLQAMVDTFHQKYGIGYSGPPRLLPEDLQEFRLKFLREELEEYMLAVASRDMNSAYDALLDLLYVVHGTLHLHGFPTEEGFKIVHEANMKKVKVERASDSKRGSIYDVVKPVGWVAPDGDLALVLGKAFQQSNGRP